MPLFLVYSLRALSATPSVQQLSELAPALGVDRRYVGRILVLATLAPDLVEAIVAGAEPSGLSLEVLANGVPMAWEEQRERTGSAH